MENEHPHAQGSNSKMTPMLIAGAVVVIIIVAVVVFAMSNNPSQQPQITAEQGVQETPVQQQEPVQSASYQDGTYDVVGNYTSPGGEESIDVTLTLQEGVVTDARVVSNATRPISKQMQAAFIGGFQEQVVGRNIDEINVVKVSSSSLTPKGFMDALSKVKAEASA